MNKQTIDGFLLIGQFSIATQLSPKALRLYDEQGLLSPAHSDTQTGYRYYRAEQIHQGRLIYRLKEMKLSLAEIRDLLQLEKGQAIAVLAQHSRKQDINYAAEKRAYQNALTLLRPSEEVELPAVKDILKPPQIVAVFEFKASTCNFIQRYFEQLSAANKQLAQSKILPTGDCQCSLVDPLSDDEGKLEILIPICEKLTTGNFTMKEIPAARYASINSRESGSDRFDLESLLDGLFDWFERHHCYAMDLPLITINNVNDSLSIEIAWAYQSHEGKK